MGGKGLFRVRVKFAGVRVALDGGVELLGIKSLEPGTKPCQLARGELLNGLLDILGGIHGQNIALTWETEKSPWREPTCPPKLFERKLEGVIRGLG